jgi:hypothetical protein
MFSVLHQLVFLLAHSAQYFSSAGVYFADHPLYVLYMFGVLLGVVYMVMRRYVGARSVGDDVLGYEKVLP